MLRLPDKEIRLLESLRGYAKEHFGTAELSSTEDGCEYSFFLGKPPKYVLKLCENVMTDQFIAHFLKQHGIPTPAIIKVDKARKLMVSAFVPNDKKFTLSVWTAVGKLMKKMHRISIAKNVFAKGVAAGIHYVQDPRREFSGKKQKLIKKIIGPFWHHINWAHSPAAPRFIHGDFGPGNILVKKGKIVAVIDAHGGFGDPLLDVATTLLPRSSEQRTAFLKGYAPGGFSSAEQKRLDNYLRLMTLWKLGTVLTLLKEAKGQKGIDKQKREWETRKEKYLAIIKSWK